MMVMAMIKMMKMMMLTCGGKISASNIERFFFLLDRWAWGPIHCLAHKKISIYSRDETTCKCHFPGIARLVEKDWHKVKIYCLVGLMCFFLSSACCPSSTSPGCLSLALITTSGGALSHEKSPTCGSSNLAP